MTGLSISQTPPAGYLEARQSAAVFDFSDRTHLEMAGADRRNFLHNFCTNEIRNLRDGDCCEAFLLNAKGRILGHILVSADQHCLRIHSVPGQATPIISHLETYHLLEDFQLSDQNGLSRGLYVTGPGSADRLGDIGLDVSDMSVLRNRCFEPDSQQQDSRISIERRDLLGTPGFLLTWSGTGATVPQRLIDKQCVEGCEEAFETLRLEAGFPVYGVDISDENLAQEVCRTDAAISFTKGCYLGQEPVARIHSLGHVNRELRTLEISGGDRPAVGTRLLSPKDPEKETGRLTSVGWSWNRGCWIAMAMVRSQFSTPGTELPLDLTPHRTATVAESADRP